MPKWGVCWLTYFWNVYPTERARSTAALIRAKEGAPLTFEGFMKAGGLNRRDALLFLLLFLPSDLVPVAPSIHLVDQGLKLNGIMPPEPIVPEKLVELSHAMIPVRPGEDF